MLVQGPTAGKWWKQDWNPSSLVILLYSCLKPTHLSESVRDSPLPISSSKVRNLFSSFGSFVKESVASKEEP